MILYFTLSLIISYSRKQQKMEIKQGLHSLRLERSLVWKKPFAARATFEMYWFLYVNFFILNDIILFFIHFSGKSFKNSPPQQCAKCLCRTSRIGLNYRSFPQIWRWPIVAKCGKGIRARGPKLYLPSTTNIWKKVLTKAIWADKKWAGFWQIRLYINKTEILNEIGI